MPTPHSASAMDWASRTGLSWRLSNTLDASFCVEALHEALERDGPPEIFNSDQGSQFTSVDVTDVLTRRAFASRWTAKAAGWTTCSSGASVIKCW